MRTVPAVHYAAPEAGRGAAELLLLRHAPGGRAGAGDVQRGPLRWVPLREVEALPMPFTASEVLRHYLREGRKTQLLYGGIAQDTGMVPVPLEEF